MSTFAAHDLVLVSPRYLAGCGSNVRDALGPLVNLFDWEYDREPGTGHLSVNSPCGSVYVDLTPTRFDGPWWTISHHEPHWTAQFSRQTPIEAIAAVTQVLPQMVGDTRHCDRIALTASTIPQTANANDWKTTVDGPATVITSPDGHCALTHTPDADNRWTFRSSLHDGFDTDWTATFTRDTPVRVVAQFFAHLASTEPVQRTFKEIPYLVQVSSSSLITPVAGASVSPHLHHAVAQAVQAHSGIFPRR
ncbi:DUF317 domain-containing protein [Streptomyces sp. NPDC004690]